MLTLPNNYLLVFGGRGGSTATDEAPVLFDIDATAWRSGDDTTCVDPQFSRSFAVIARAGTAEDGTVL